MRPFVHRMLFGFAVTAASASATALLSWSDRNQGLSNGPFSQVLWDGTRYLALGSSGVSATSPDGAEWTAHPAPFATFRQAASSGTRTVAVEVDGIRASGDGIAWQNVALPSHWGGFTSIHWSGKLFLLNGIYNAVDSIAVSADGLAWSLRHLGTGASTNGLPQTFAQSGGVLVMAGPGGISWSGDSGATWAKAASGQPSLGVAWLDTAFFSKCATGFQTSRDGAVWTAHPAIEDSLRAAAGGPETWLELGSLGGRLYLAGARVYASRDGHRWARDTALETRWSRHRAALPTRVSALRPEHGRLFLLEDGGTIWSSTDGTSWTRRSGRVTGQTLRSIAGSSGIWIAVGDAGTILRSEDGRVWNAVEGVPATAPLRKVFRSSRGFMALGDSGTALSSSLGTAWTRVPVGTGASLLDGLATDSTWVLLGDSDRVFVSRDASSWQAVRLAQGSDRFRHIAAAGGRHAAVGEGGATAWSEDGRAWTEGGAAGQGPLDACAWSGRFFLASGADALHWSRDAARWNSAPLSGRLASIVASGTALLAVGVDGVVRTIDQDTLVGASIGAPTARIAAMAVSDSLWVQVGEDGAIFAATAPSAPLAAAGASVAGFSIRQVRDGLRISIPGDDVVELEIVQADGSGRRTIAFDRMPAGIHVFPLPRAPGVRFARLRVGSSRTAIPIFDMR